MSTLLSLILVYFVQRHLVNYPLFKSLQQNCSSDWMEDVLFRAQILANEFTKVPIFCSCALFILSLSLCVLILETIMYYLSGQLGLFLFSFIILFYCFSVANKKQYASFFVEYFENKFAILFWFITLGPVGAVLYLLCSLYGSKHNAINSDQNCLVKSGLDGNSVVDYENNCNNLKHDEHQSKKGKPENELHYAKSISNCLFSLHTILAWLPARITGLIFILVGSFDKGFDCWKNVLRDWVMPHTKVLNICGEVSLGEKNLDHSLQLVERAFVGWVIFCIIIKLIA